MPESELTLESKEAIRAYVFKLLAPPALVVSILTFLLGFSIREGATGRAMADALKDITPKLMAALATANEASASAQTAKNIAQTSLTETTSASAAADRAKTSATSVLSEAEALAKRLKSLEELQKALQQTDQLVSSLAKVMAENPDLKREILAALNANYVKVGSRITLRSGTDPTRLLNNNSEQAGLSVGGTIVNAQRVPQTSGSVQWTVEAAPNSN